jgi:NADPH-dependent curcumin reductase
MTREFSWGGIVMSDSINRQWILDARPTGHLTGKEFRWNETSIPKPTDGQALVRNLWLSFDPTQRNWMARDSYVPMVPLGARQESIFPYALELTGV